MSALWTFIKGVGQVRITAQRAHKNRKWKIMSKKSEIEAFLAEAAEQTPKTESVFPIREKMKAEFDTLYSGMYGNLEDYADANMDPRLKAAIEQNKNLKIIILGIHV